MFRRIFAPSRCNQGHSHPLSMRPSCYRDGKRPLAVWLALSCSPPVQGGIPENGSLFSADRGQIAKQSAFDGLLVSVTRELAVNHHHPPPVPESEACILDRGRVAGRHTSALELTNNDRDDVSRLSLAYSPGLVACFSMVNTCYVCHTCKIDRDDISKR